MIYLKEPVKEAAKSVGVEPKLHKRSLSPPLSSGGHRHRSDVKSARTVEPSPSILPTSSSGRAVTLDTILIDSRLDVFSDIVPVQRALIRFFINNRYESADKKYERLSLENW